MDTHSQIHEIVRASIGPNVLQTTQSWLMLSVSSYPRTPEEEAQSNQVWLKGHTGGYTVDPSRFLSSLTLCLEI